MLVTSVSISQDNALVWRKHHRAIMRSAIRTLRVQMRINGVERGVTRRYNRANSRMEIVTTRFTEAEYDTLHFVAASLRVSVSLLVTQMIQMWLKLARRNRPSRYVTNYEHFTCNWSENAGVLTESLFFYPKINQIEREIQTIEYKITSAS